MAFIFTLLPAVKIYEIINSFPYKNREDFQKSGFNKALIEPIYLIIGSWVPINNAIEIITIAGKLRRRITVSLFEWLDFEN